MAQITFATSTSHNSYASHKQLPVDEFVAKIDDRWGCLEYCESFLGGQETRAFFDHDIKFASKEAADAGYWAWVKDCHDAVQRLFDSFELGPLQVLHGARQGRFLPDGQYKISLRSYLPTIKMRPCDIKILIHAACPPADIKRLFDTSIYPAADKRHALFMQGTKKPQTDAVMEPVSLDFDSNTVSVIPRPFPAGHLQQYVVQHLTPNMHLVSIPDSMQRTTRQSERGRVTNPMRLHTNYESTERATTDQAAVIEAMKAAAPSYDFVSCRGDSFTFQKAADGTATCPYGESHLSNNTVYVHARPDGLLEAFCCADGCREAFKTRPAFIGRWQPVACMFGRSASESSEPEDSEESAIKDAIEEIMIGGDRGLAQLVADEICDDVKCDGKDDFIAFDPDSCLWVSKYESHIRNRISEIIHSHLSTHWQTAKRRRLSDVELMSNLRQLLSKANSSALAGRVYSFIKDKLTFPTKYHCEQFHDSLDSIGHILSVQNGVIDLRTGALLPRQRDHMLTSYLPLTFDPSAVHQRNTWDDIILQMFAGNREEAEWFGMVMAYQVAGDPICDIFPILQSKGRSGKTTILEGLTAMLGNLVKKGHPGMIFSNRPQPNNEDAERAALAGKRFQSFSENEENAKIQVDAFNSMSGGDGFTAARKYHGPMTVTPRFSNMAVCNFDLVFPDPMPFSCGSRIVIIRMLVTFIEGLTSTDNPLEQPLDPKLRDFVNKDPASQHDLLHFCVRHAIRWYAAPSSLKLSMPPRIRADTDAFINKQDLLKKFLDTHCTAYDYTTSRADLQDNFASIMGKKLSHEDFKKGMESHGHICRPGDIDTGTGPRRQIRGYKLRIKTDDELDS